MRTSVIVIATVRTGMTPWFRIERVKSC
jgi:hypothetical protein